MAHGINYFPLFKHIVHESKSTTYNKTYLAYQYLYRNISDKYDWYMKVKGKTLKIHSPGCVFVHS